MTAKDHVYVPFTFVRDFLLPKVYLRGVVIYALTVTGTQFGVYLFDHLFDVHYFRENLC